MTTGLFLGKFMPPHKGHAVLAYFAENYVDELFIVVGSLKNEPISGDIRFKWMSEMFPNSTVLHLQEELPQLPEEHPDFWQLWHDALTNILPKSLDYVFAGEDYGENLAKTLGAQFIPANMGRELIPTSGTDIRNQPFKNWHYIPETIRPYFVKKVCLIGAESTGKTMLTEKLAKHFETIHVPEYAYSLINSKGKDLSKNDMKTIAKGQISSENALVRYANKLLICDTDIITTSIWHEILFGDCPEWLENEAGKGHYDITFMMDTNTEWVDDIHRYSLETQSFFQQRCIEKLELHKRKYITLSGDWSEKFDTACLHIDGLYSNSN